MQLGSNVSPEKSQDINNKMRDDGVLTQKLVSHDPTNSLPISKSGDGDHPNDFDLSNGLIEEEPLFP